MLKRRRSVPDHGTEEQILSLYSSYTVIITNPCCKDTYAIRMNLIHHSGTNKGPLEIPTLALQ